MLIGYGMLLSSSIAQIFTRPLSLDIDGVGVQGFAFSQGCVHAHRHPTHTPEHASWPEVGAM